MNMQEKSPSFWFFFFFFFLVKYQKEKPNLIYVRHLIFPVDVSLITTFGWPPWAVYSGLCHISMTGFGRLPCRRDQVMNQTLLLKKVKIVEKKKLDAWQISLRKWMDEKTHPAFLKRHGMHEISSIRCVESNILRCLSKIKGATPTQNRTFKEPLEAKTQLNILEMQQKFAQHIYHLKYGAWICRTSGGGLHEDSIFFNLTKINSEMMLKNL